MDETRKINTEFIHPPIPIRWNDWIAWFDDYDEGDLVGVGETEQEAVDDLLSQDE